VLEDLNKRVNVSSEKSERTEESCSWIEKYENFYGAQYDRILVEIFSYHWNID
jgi:hypothetical protein